MIWESYKEKIELIFSWLDVDLYQRMGIDWE